MATTRRSARPQQAGEPGAPPDRAEPDPDDSQGSAVPLLKRGSPLLRWMVGGFVVLVVVASVGGTIVASFGNLPDFDWRWDGRWVALAVAGFTVLNLVHGSLWRILPGLLRAPLGISRGLAIWCTSGLARYTPGTMLYSALRIAMAQSEGVPLRTGLASVIYELALTLTSAVIVGAYALVRGDPLHAGAVRWLILALPLIAVVVLHPRIFRPISDAVLRRVKRPVLSHLLPFGTLLWVLGLYCLSWVLAGLSLYALMQGLHPVQPDDLLLVIAAPAVGIVAAVIGFMIPGGLGARETGVAAVLSLTVPFSVAFAVAIALRLVQLAIELICAAVISLAAERIARRAAAA